MSKASRRTARVYLCGAAAIAFGCSVETEPQPKVERAPAEGSPGLALTLPSGALIETIDYAITGNAIAPLTGTVSVLVAGATLSALVRDIPEGQGYLLTLVARTTDGASTCSGRARFDVAVGVTTQIPVTLLCRATGSAITRVNSTVPEAVDAGL